MLQKYRSIFLCGLVLVILAGCAGSQDSQETSLEKFKDCEICPEMVAVPSGSFMMGSEDGQSDERPVHRVDINYSFAVGVYEVSQAEWFAVMGSNPSWKTDLDSPVTTLSWYKAKKFIEKLNRVTGFSYRLLTEAEWEYLAKGGVDVDDDGAGSAILYSNKYGVQALRRGIWEWIEDCYYDSYERTPTDGSAAQGSKECPRVIRGGNVGSSITRLDVSFRMFQRPGIGTHTVGLRLARNL